MSYDHMDYCHNNNNINMSDKEVNENLNPEVTLQDGEDRNFDDVLINIVKGYPHLYDCSCKDDRDVIKKENSWVEISKIMNTSPDVCCNRWARLRESFSKEKKKRQNEMTSGSGASKRRGFVYFESMKFIDKFVKTRKQEFITFDSVILLAR
ncbi:Transcription factor Adf-1 [Formica fusca]